jgi:hypothetical protein
LDVARGQEAKALELHAAMSLSRLWQQQGFTFPPTMEEGRDHGNSTKKRLWYVCY